MSDSSSLKNVEALGQSEVFLDFQERLSRVAPVERPVLLIGERGTGKELAAARLHFLSQRWQKAFVTLNCNTLSPALIESELFGHEKGAFTGAEGRRVGRFEAAHGGTLFLDEIGTIPIEVQEKILRVVEYGSFERVGGSNPIDVDVRIIGATNADLPAMAGRGEFKRDLLDRLSFEVLFLPPLRYRKGDIMLLSHHFAARMAYELGKEGVVFSQRAIKALKGHSWMGNIRELKNVIERAVYKAGADRIESIDFDPFSSPYGFREKSDNSNSTIKEMKQSIKQTESKASFRSFKAAVGEFELNLIKDALEQARHNQKKAAQILGLTYDQLRGLLRKYRKALEESFVNLVE